MAFPIIPKRRSGAPGNPASLQLGELAVNTADGELYLGGDGGVMLLNGPVAAGTTVTEHTGDGTTVAFTFGGFNGTADGGYIVSVGGIDQPPSKYSISSTAGGTITFVEAPVDGELISIRAIVAGSGGGGSGDATSLQGRAVAATAPTNGQFLKWNETANQWEPGDLSYQVDVLVVAGGGGGGSGHAGGGGAGGYRTTTATLLPGVTCEIVVGAGGIGGNYTLTPATGGEDSKFLTTGINIVSLGGGAGGGNNPEPRDGGNGGSGGGGANAVSGAGAGGSGTLGQGFDGGTGSGGGNWAAAGGGGAAEAGQSNPTTEDGGDGGSGSNWLSLGTFYAGGGGGCGGLGIAGVGGLGGGGNGTIQDAGPAAAAAANTGGGGGGARNADGGNGGSGIVILRYAGTQRGNGGTVTSAGGYTYHTFTSSGTFTA